ncbi:MAG TPA: DNA polymerase III subunit gamma/tau [Marinagarivorans sp.]
MSYQVLARKWRPRIFREMVGQEHVLKALINALDHNRLHHAYLFTGTRGVGKTTIARILAKCLNCETGVSSEPCGQCASCVEIAEGRFVDLIEVDAASRTRVEDTRELLDNVQYAPTRGRYKIYLIDEVHMLSTHSFNALLKTLEEPPEHVKFLLATTDPQKLPVTILSRCLQFNLKNMSPERIVGHLQFVLGEEVIPFEDAALWQLARSADGSMRDALSLTDQAIAFGSGKVADADVVSMLGTIDHTLIEKLVRALINGSGPDILTAVAEFSEHAPDYYGALGELITFLHRIAIAQAMPEALDNSYGDRKVILELCQLIPPEDVQLFYQVALTGRRDLHLSPDPRSGLEMTLLRMLAFKPQGVADVPTQALPSTQTAKPRDTGEAPAQAQPSTGPKAPAPSAPEQPPKQGSHAEPASPPPSPEPATPQAAPSQPVPATAPPANLESYQPDSYQEVPPWADANTTAPQREHDTHPATPEHQEVADTVKKPLEALRNAPGLDGLKTASQITPRQKPVVTEEPTLQAVATPPSVSIPSSPNEIKPEHWLAIYQMLGVKGVLLSTVANCALVRVDDGHFFFLLDQNKGALFDESHKQRFNDLLNDYFNAAVKVHIDLAELPASVITPAIDADNRRQQALADAVNRMQREPFVQDLQAQFGAVLHIDSVKVH